MTGPGAIATQPEITFDAAQIEAPRLIQFVAGWRRSNCQGTAWCGVRRLRSIRASLGLFGELQPQPRCKLERAKRQAVEGSFRCQLSETRAIGKTKALRRDRDDLIERRLRRGREPRVVEKLLRQRVETELCLG